MRSWRICAAGAIALTLGAAMLPAQRQPQLPREGLAQQNFGADAPWFLRNIPFLEIDDPEIQQIYYYRWKLYRSHIREIGPQGTTVTEFLDDVPWARHPYTDLNDSASFHILEGRWLRDPQVVNSLINHLYTGGGNDRHFSESIAAATEASTRVTGDTAPALHHLDTMEYIFNQWDDHLDRTRNLYWIEPLLDATEYTISSIDASGAGFTDHPSTDQNHNGFTGGYAFRPSINSYQYANAWAIARFARIAGQPAVAADYTARAEIIQRAVLTQLWNPQLAHFTDRYQRSTPTVQAGEFIRGRELVGYLPWFYELPPKNEAIYSAAWGHALSAKELGGPNGLRTVEPSYPKYMEQYRYDQPTGLRECQWNGPSWPFQTSQALTAMANLLADYPVAGVTQTDYLRLLRQYTHQHLLQPGHPDLQEDYDPQTGQPIVGLPRSHHYNHSTYVDLILSGLIGVRPRADDTLEIHPLMPVEGELPIHYFAVQDLAYHGHSVSVIYDRDGSRYHVGRGLSVYVDGIRRSGPGSLRRIEIPLPTKTTSSIAKARVDLAVNPGLTDGPVATASSTGTPGSAMEAIDGRMWFFPENPNGWSPAPGDLKSWYAVDLGQTSRVSSLELYLFADSDRFQAPSALHVQRRTAAGWEDIPQQHARPLKPLANGETVVLFPAINVKELRVVFTGPDSPAQMRLIEMKVFGP